MPPHAHPKPPAAAAYAVSLVNSGSSSLMGMLSVTCGCGSLSSQRGISTLSPATRHPSAAALRARYASNAAPSSASA